LIVTIEYYIEKLLDPARSDAARHVEHRAYWRIDRVRLVDGMIVTVKNGIQFDSRLAVDTVSLQWLPAADC
jgi:hypothetical protein